MSMIASNKLECRKVRKPKIEKLRRARINSSLESLKEILLRNTISIPQGSRPTKLEKADILEMTVRYINMMHEKIPSLNEKSPGKSMETFGTIHWSPGHERVAFSDVTNQMDEKQKPTQIFTDNKAWFNNRGRLQRQNSSSIFDKENLTIELNQSMLEEHHWRPW